MSCVEIEPSAPHPIHSVPYPLLPLRRALYQEEIDHDPAFYQPTDAHRPAFVGISNKNQPNLTRYAIVYCKRRTTIVIDLSSDSEDSEPEEQEDFMDML